MRIGWSTSLTLAATLIAGCQTTSYEGNENSPYYVVPTGSRLTLNQSVTIPPESASVYIQNGQTMGNTQVLHYYPFCKFELYHRGGEARTVAPDSIVITRVVSNEQQDPVVDAGLPQYADAMNDVMAPGYHSVLAWTTRMDLHSEKNPEIFRLTCARIGYGDIEDSFVTISEMRRTLDPLFTLTTTLQQDTKPPK